MPPTLVCKIICEGVREETGNKSTLFGVLGKRLLIQPDTHFPSRLVNLALFTRWIGLHEGENVSLRIEYADAVLLDQKNSSVKPKLSGKDDYVQVIFQLPGFPLKGFGEYCFKIFVGTNDKPIAEEILSVLSQES